jgi:glyoxylase-like metal-dependent hydrolase (beta-lactamase superfamily II)
MEISMSIRFACLASTAVMALALSACAPKLDETAAAPAAAPVAEAPAAPAIMPFGESAEVKPFRIGLLEAAALHDGDLEVPNDNKVLAVNKKKADVDAVLTANNLPTDKLKLSVQPLIVRSADKLMLFDTGAAALFGPTAGKLRVSLYATSVDPASVTDIFISHAHGDHVGGLVGTDALYFPNAAIHMSANEWAAMKADKNMAPMVALITPKVVEFQPSAELVPGTVKAMDIQGHTPGHSGYMITSGTESLLYIGDTMHHSVISVQQPDWTIAFDGDAPTAQASRKALIESSAAAGRRIYAVHFPFPGLGKFEKQGDKFVWVAEK